jgi:HEAT repeat protein
MKRWMIAVCLPLMIVACSSDTKQAKGPVDDKRADRSHEDRSKRPRPEGEGVDQPNADSPKDRGEEQPSPTSEDPVQLATPSGEPDIVGPITPQESAILEYYYDEDSQPKLFALLEHRNPKVRAAAAEHVQYIDDVPDDARRALLRLLRDPNVEVRRAVAETLNYRVDLAGSAIPELTASLREPDDKVANYCARALGKQGENAAGAVWVLVGLLSNEQRVEMAIDAIGLIGPQAKEAEPYLIPLLDHFLWSGKAATALGRIGAAEPLLRRVRMREKEDYPAQSELIALGYVNPTTDEIVDVLVRYTAHEYVCDDVCAALGNVRPTNEKVVAGLGKVLTTSTSEWDRSVAAGALGLIDPKLESAVPFLLSALQDENSSVRETAARSLADFTLSPKTRVLALLATSENDGGLSWSTAALIREVRDEAYPIVLEAARDTSGEDLLRAHAVEMLASLADGHEDEVRRVLNEILESGDTSVSVAAAAAAEMNRFGQPTDRQKQALIAGLQQSDIVDIREKAVIALQHRHGQEDDAVAALLVALDDSEGYIFSYTAGALADLKVLDAVPPLARIAHESEPRLRIAACNALAEFGTDARESVPALMTALNHDDPFVVGAATAALPQVIDDTDSRAKQIAGALMALLSHENEYVRETAIGSLAKLPSDASALAIDRLTALLTDDSSSIRQAAGVALGDIGAPAARATPGILRLLQDEEARGLFFQRDEIIAALGNIGSHAELVVPALIRELDRDDDIEEAVKVLGKYGADAKPAVPKLAALLQHPDEDTRERIAETLGTIGAEAQGSAPALRAALREDPIGSVRAKAARALIQIAPDDEASMQAVVALLDADSYVADAVLDELGDRAPALLTKAIQNDDPRIRAGALERLRQQDDPSAFASAYVAALADDEPEVRWSAAWALAEIGGYEREIAPVLVEMLREVETSEDYEARDAIRQLGRQGIDPLVAVVSDAKADAGFRARACRLLGDLGRPARRAAPHLQAALASDDPLVRGWAAVALADVRPDLRDVDKLIESLQSDDAELRSQSAGALRSGYSDYEVEYDEGRPAADNVFAALANAVHDDDENVRSTAGYSLGSYALSEQQCAALIEALQDDQSRGPAAQALSWQSQVPPEAVSSLIGLLRSADEELQELAAQSLTATGDSAIAPLLDLARDESAPASSRTLAVRALGNREELSNATRDELVPLMGSGEALVRVQTAAVVGRHGRADRQVLEALVEGLSIDDWQVYESVDLAFRSLGKEAAPAADLVLQRLEGAEEDERAHAAEVLATIAPDSEIAPAAIAAQLFQPYEEDYTPGVFRYALAKYGARALPPLEQALASGDSKKVNPAAAALGELGKRAKPALPKLIELLAGDDPDVAIAAASAIAHIEPHTDGVVPILIPALDAENAQQRREAFEALSRLGPRAAPAVDKLINLLDDEEWSSWAASVLGRIGPAAAPAVPKLVEMMQSDDYEYDAVMALRGIGEAAHDAVPELVAGLSNERRHWMAVSALSSMGKAGEPAIAVLTDLLANEDWQLDAARALGRFEERAAPAVDALVNLLDRDDVELQAAAVEALGSIGPAAAASETKLIALLEGGNPRVRDEAVGALGKLKTPNALPTLMKALAESQGGLKRSVLAAIGNLGPDAAPAVAMLIEAVDDPITRRNAVSALGSIGPAAAPATDRLVPLLSSDQKYERTAAAAALGSIGPEAKAAIPDLIEMLAANDAYVRQVAGEALGKIDPATAEKVGVEKPVDDESE